MCYSNLSIKNLYQYINLNQYLYLYFNKMYEKTFYEFSVNFI